MRLASVLVLSLASVSSALSYSEYLSALSELHDDHLHQLHNVAHVHGVHHHLQKVPGLHGHYVVRNRRRRRFIRPRRRFRFPQRRRLRMEFLPPCHYLTIQP